MRDLTRTFTLFSRIIFDEFDTPDWWQIAKSITKGSFFSVPVMTFRFIYAIIENDWWYMSEHYTSHGCKSSASIFRTQKTYDCPDKEIEKKLRNISNDHLTTSLKNQSFILTGSTIILLWTLGDMIHFLIKKHQEDWKRLKSQELIKKKSNLPELSEKAKELKAKYGSFYEIKKSSQTRHPDFLCEPGTHQLMDLPPVVSCDGYAHGFTQFALIAKQNQNSGSFGIIDQPLLGLLLAYIQDQPLPTEKILQPNKFNLLKTIKMIIILLQDLAKELRHLIRKLIFWYVVGFTGLGSYYYFQKSSSHELTSMKNSNFLKFAGWSVLLLPLIKLDPAELYRALMHFYESQIRGDSQGYTSEEIKNSRLITVSSLFMCPLSQALLDKAVICQDGNTYEAKFIKQHFKENATRSSPISKIEFKDYPLMWPYHQRRKQIQKLTRENYFNLTR